MNPIEVLNKYLADHQVLTLATYGTDGIWCCSVYFGYNDGKFYFSSKKKTRHATNIDDGAEIAFAIADSSQTPATATVGIQGVGYCRPARLSETLDVIKHYGKRFTEYNDTFGNLAKLKELIQGGVNLPYVIEVHSIKFLDENIFGGYEFINFT